LSSSYHWLIIFLHNYIKNQTPDKELEIWIFQLFSAKLASALGGQAKVLKINNWELEIL
jgi:hypothetical protein